MEESKQAKEKSPRNLPNPMPKQNPFTPTLPINSCKSSSGNGGRTDNDTRPIKKEKVESPQIIAPVLLREFCSFFGNDTRVFSPTIISQPKLPASTTVLSPSLGPKITASAELDGHISQNILKIGKVAPPPVLALRNKTPVAVKMENYIQKQFWKAGDYDVAPCSVNWELHASGSDHIRVHPRFLHSNATSHKWVLGAFAELLDNSLDEVLNGATIVKIDTIENKKNGGKMLIIEDNGGGMDPARMRQCMSLGYSSKSKIANSIGQYGNGFKTSTMRLGADVIVFSRSCGKEGERSTQSIGLLSYTFLRSTKKEDIEVPILDYERKGKLWKKVARSTSLDVDWNKKLDTIVQWSPFSSELDLLEQFNNINDHGTRIFIYNLWEDDQGELELDFDTDPHDIQIRGANRNEKNIQMAKQYPNSRHFLTYQHSLRSYASILYLRVPPNFRMILRGKDVENHNVVNDMMMTQQVTYRPQHSSDGKPRDPNIVANVTVGFVKDAKSHIDVQGFNVYHKNRLIKPFWRVWHPAGSDGRGVIEVLEANFVEPAHDKQGFERTLALSRLETKLAQMQKTYWSTNCHKIGYAPRQTKKSMNDVDQPCQETKSERSTELHITPPIQENKVSFPSQSMHKNQNGHVQKQNVESRTSGSDNAGLSNNGNNHKNTYSPNQNSHMEKQNVESRASGSDNIELSNNGNNHNNTYSLKTLPLKRVQEENNSQTINLPPHKKSRSTVDVEATNVDNKSGNLHSQKSLLPIKKLLGRNNFQAVRSFPRRMSRTDDDDDKQFNTNDNRGDIRSQNSLPEKISPQTEQSSPHRSPTLVENNGGEPMQMAANVESKSDGMGHEFSHSTEELTKENQDLRERLRMKEREFLGDLLKDLDEERNKRKILEADLDQERNKNNILESQLLEAKRKIEEQKKEQDDLIDIFSNERKRREVDEENLRKKLKNALYTIKALQNRA